MKETYTQVTEYYQKLLLLLASSLEKYLWKKNFSLRFKKVEGNSLYVFALSRRKDIFAVSKSKQMHSEVVYEAIIWPGSVLLKATDVGFPVSVKKSSKA